MSFDDLNQSLRCEIQRLASGLLDKQLDQQGLERLKALLGDDPAARVFFVECMELHALLEAWHETTLDASVNAHFEQMARRVVGINDYSCDLESPSGSFEVSSARKKHYRFMPVMIGMGLAVGLLVAGGIGLWMANNNVKGGRPSPYLGVLSRTVAARWSDRTPRLTVPARLAVGQRLVLEAGYAELTLSSGCTCALKGPAEVELVSPMCLRATRGAIWARVGEEAKGFVIETPTAQIVDLGTEFGVNVDRSASATDVVVFEGAVDLLTSTAAQRSSSRLTSGEALRVDRSGITRRITSVRSEQYPRTARSPAEESRPSLFGSVTDNIRDPNASMYYQIVRAGLFEDSRVYVDRRHEWNGVDELGIPSFLKGADYVMCFNSDKWSSTLEITVDVVAPARLYVLFDERLPIPAWLVDGFTKTGFQIGVDDGYAADDPAPQRTDFGPGNSVDTVYSIWQRDVTEPGPVRFGALPKSIAEVSMYGIAATPLEDAKSFTPPTGDIF